MNHPFDQHGNWAGSGENDFDPSTYKVRLTLPDDSTVELYASEIEQASQEMGDVRTIHDICGIHPLFGPCYCPKCKANGDLDGCGRHFVVDTQRDEPGLIEVQLKNGQVLYAKDCERVSDMEERAGYGYTADWSGLAGGITSVTFAKQEDYTFLVILPNGDRREVKAAYMEVDGSTLYFEDDNRETILAFGPGHWVWAVRVEEDDQND